MLAVRRAISLVEVLVVIGIIGVLVGLTLPAIQQSRASASRLGCQNSMKQIGLALHNYHDSHGGLPPRPSPAPAGDPNATLGWMALILPQIEQGDLYRTSAEACRIDPNPLHNPPHLALSVVVQSYVCPADGRLSSPLTDQSGIRAAFSSYIGIGGIVPAGRSRGFNGAFAGPTGTRFSEVTDGLSQTIFVGERPPPDSLQAGWWYPAAQGYSDDFRGPNNTIALGGLLIFAGDPCQKIQRVFGPGRTVNPCDRFHLWSLHPGGGNFLLGDGSVRYLSYSAEPLVISLASRDGGELVEFP